MADAPVPKAIVRGELPAYTPSSSEPPVGAVVVPTYTLYTAGQMVLATFLGSPVAGCWLLGRNYKRLGRIGTARASVLLGVAWTAALVGIGYVTPALRVLGLASIFIMRGVAYAQRDDLERHVCRGGKTASWGVPVGVGFAGLVLVLGLVVGGAVGYEMLTTPPKIEVGQGEVYYADDTTESQALAIGKNLHERGFFSRRASVKLHREGGRAVISFVVIASAFDDRESRNFFHDIVGELSTVAFAGEPVDIWLTDEYLEPKVKLEWEDRTQRVAFGGNTVTFRNGVSEQEARGVGQVLVDYGLFESNNWTVAIKQNRKGRVVVVFSVNYEERLNAEFHTLCAKFSNSAFGGEPVDVDLTDGDKLYATLTWEMRPRDPIEVGIHKVSYTVTESEARAVASVLADLLAKLHDPIEVVVRREADRAVVELPLANDPKLALHRYSALLSDEAFQHQPVDLWLTDVNGELQVKLFWEMRPAAPKRR